MKRFRTVAGLSLLGGAATVLTACSIDTVIWGAEGARVIQVTEEVIQEVTAGELDPRKCVDSTADFGDPQQWTGLSAGEPGRLQGDFWDEQQALGATWSINLEGLQPRDGAELPSDVFYREIDDELCIVDIVWSTVTF